MRKKTPASHSYTIVGLLITIVAVSLLTLYSLNGEREDTAELTAPSTETHTSQLEVSDESGATRLLPGSNSGLVQNSQPGIQSAGGYETYDRYDSGSQTGNPQQGI